MPSKDGLISEEKILQPAAMTKESPKDIIALVFDIKCMCKNASRKPRTPHNAAPLL